MKPLLCTIQKVLQFLTEKDNQLPLKSLLVMDNSLAHPPDLEHILLKEFSFITVKFLPPNTLSLSQPRISFHISRNCSQKRCSTGTVR